VMRHKCFTTIIFFLHTCELLMQHVEYESLFLNSFLQKIISTYFDFLKESCGGRQGMLELQGHFDIKKKLNQCNYLISDSNCDWFFSKLKKNIICLYKFFNTIL
jgi:hypothetical protein